MVLTSTALRLKLLLEALRHALFIKESKLTLRRFALFLPLIHASPLAFPIFFPNFPNRFPAYFRLSLRCESTFTGLRKHFLCAAKVLSQRSERRKYEGKRLESVALDIGKGRKKNGEPEGFATLSLIDLIYENAVYFTTFLPPIMLTLPF